MLDEVLCTPAHATEDASDQRFVRPAAMCDTRCYGTSCEVAEIINDCLNSPTRSALGLCVRVTDHHPDYSRSATTVHIACVYSDAGRITTVMSVHMPAIHLRVRNDRCPVEMIIAAAAAARPTCPAEPGKWRCQKQTHCRGIAAA